MSSGEVVVHEVESAGKRVILRSCIILNVSRVIVNSQEYLLYPYLSIDNCSILS